MAAPAYSRSADRPDGQGTLLLPALSYTTVTPEQPVFSVRETPSCVKLSALSDGLRRAAERTSHPLGMRRRAAREMTEEHPLDRTPVGPHPLPQADGVRRKNSLMLGCGLTPKPSCTEWKRKLERPVLPVFPEGRLPPASCRTAGYRRPHAPLVRRNNPATGQRSLGTGAALRPGGGSRMRLYGRQSAAEAALPKMREEPWFFVDRQ